MIYFFWCLVVWIVIESNVLMVLLCLLNNLDIILEFLFNFNVNWVILLELMEKLLKCLRNWLVNKVLDGILYIIMIFRLFLLCLSFWWVSLVIIVLVWVIVCMKGIIILMLVKFILLWICLIVLYFSVK